MMIRDLDGLFVVDTERRGQLVVCLHGGSVDSRVWTRVVEADRTQRRYVTYDRRGYGRSRDTAIGQSHTGDALTVLEDVGPADTLIGASLGGAIAVDAALARPDLVGRLVLIGPLVVGRKSSETPRRG